MLREGRQRVLEHHAKRDVAWAGTQVMYFETGQGSALSAGAHHGIDQLMLEARAYGVARAFDPFLVNSVVGFIGPEYLYDERQIIRAGLEDHFMGKLLGLPMGCDVCYTNHAEADQNSADNFMLLLAAAGCNYFMGRAVLRNPVLIARGTLALEKEFYLGNRAHCNEVTAIGDEPQAWTHWDERNHPGRPEGVSSEGHSTELAAFVCDVRGIGPRSHSLQSGGGNDGC
jgi:hypothetical protein